jgi:hypothetical protein
MPAPPPATGYPVADYDLNIHDGEASTVWRLTDSGVRLAGDRIAWSIGQQSHQALLADIVSIRLTTAIETARGPEGATSCQIRFASGDAVTVFGGNSFNADEAERIGRYRAFVDDLHHRLGTRERASIRFIAGFGGARFATLLVCALLSIALTILAPLVLLAITGAPRLLLVLAGGVFLNAGLLRLLQRNAPHVYDPDNPAGSAAAGSVADTIGYAIAEIRSGMTPSKGLAWSAVGGAIVAILVLIIASHQTASLFESGRARLAFDAILQRTGPLTADKVEVTPEVLTIEAPDPHGRSSRNLWRASRRTLFGWREWDHVSGPDQKFDTAISDDLSQEPFAPDHGDVANLDALAKAALARAAIEGGAVTRMTLTAAAPFIRPEPPRWTVEITSSRRSVRLLAERGGKLFPAASPPLGPPRIVIHATVNAWIRVLNVDQSVLFDDILKAGSSYSVPNIPGVTLRTGLAGSLDITVDGKLVPSIGGSRHDILLEPQALIAGTAIQD